MGRSNSGTSQACFVASTITTGARELSTSAVDAWKRKSRRRYFATGEPVADAMTTPMMVLLTRKNAVPAMTTAASRSGSNDVISASPALPTRPTVKAAAVHDTVDWPTLKAAFHQGLRCTVSDTSEPAAWMAIAAGRPNMNRIASTNVVERVTS